MNDGDTAQQVIDGVNELLDVSWAEIVAHGRAPLHGVIPAYELHLEKRRITPHAHCLHGPLKSGLHSFPEFYRFDCCGGCDFRVLIKPPLSLGVQQLAQQFYPIFIFEDHKELLASVRHGYLLTMKLRGLTEA